VSISRKYLSVVSLAGLGTAVLAGAQQTAAPGSPNDLKACVAIAAEAERVVCYDKLAGRAVTPPATSAGAGSQPSAASQASAKAPAAQTSPTAPAPPSAPASAGTAASPVTGSKEAFGLYAAEHPSAPKSAVDSVTGKVVALSYDSYGRETVSLEGGPMWQLAGSDALLANGDSVTVKRAVLGSYILTTPSGRTHRVRRLR
jgi:hypothetical protein